MTLPSAPAHPLIGFGQVMHQRLRPARNAFTYPTYFLLLPMRSLHDKPGNSGALAHNRRGALSFHDSDHGEGGDNAVVWLDALLQREGIDDAVGELWLHTYPRVLGYTFKPVSFWYCHRADGTLRAIVAEVNNTFGERHCYLLDPPQGITYGQELSADKVFHVSPFCTLAGSYRFRFLHSGGAGQGNANMGSIGKTVARIDYYDGAPEAGPVLKTSVSGTLEPLTAASVRKALWRYPAMTLGVMARIHWQAFKLWRKRVGFHRKPHLPNDSVTR